MTPSVLASQTPDPIYHMNPTKPKNHPSSPARHPHPAYVSAFDRLDQALAKNTQASGLTFQEKLRSLRRRLFGVIPEDFAQPQTQEAL